MLLLAPYLCFAFRIVFLICWISIHVHLHRITRKILSSFKDKDWEGVRIGANFHILPIKSKLRV